MNISQLSEQLKDVPQGTLVGYAKNPNSVVPQFLALAEIQRRQHLEAQAPAPTGTVADDVLAQANPVPQPMAPQQVDPRMMQAQAMQHQAQQLPEHQPGVAQLPTGMPQGMAGGGIVAFAGGGGLSLDTDDEEDDREMAQLFPQQSSSKFEQLLEALPSSVAGGIRGLADKGAQAYQAVKAAVPASYEQAKAAAVSGKDAVEGDIQGFLSKIQHLESRGKHFDANGKLLTSPKGAEGIMQVMPKTQRDPGYGIVPARDKSPEELKRVGDEYGIAMLREFGDPRLAAMAYNWGPGNVKKWLASDRKMAVPAETQKYASNFSKGGITQHFAEGGNPEFNPYAMMGDLGVSQPEYTSGEGLGIGNYLKRKLMGVQDVPVAPSTSAPSDKDWQAFDQAQALFEAEQRLKPSAEPKAAYVPLKEYDIGFGANKSQPDTADTVTPKTKSELYAEALANSIEKQAAEAEQNKKMQLGLSLLGAAGSGLKSGSRYLGQGLGDTLTGGVSTYGALKKQEQDQAKDIMAAQLGLYKYGSAAESTAELREQNKIIREAQLAQNKKNAETQDYNTKLSRVQAIDKAITDQVMAPYKNNELYKLNPEKFEAKIQADLAAARQGNDLYRTLMADLGVPVKPITAAGPVVVQTPKGPVSFPNQAAADQFKQKAGIK